MKKFGNNWIYWTNIFSLVFALTAHAQNTVCKDNLGKGNDLYVDVPLKDAYYLAYDVYFTDSSKYIITKPIDTVSVEAIISRDNGALLTQGAKLKFNRRLSFSYNLKKYIVIRYQIFYADGRMENRIVQFLNKDGVWTNVGLNANADLVYIVNVLKPQGFWCFYSSENQSTCSEINSFKSQIKNFDGTVNTKNLAAVVRKNENTLSKYLDK